MKKILLSLAAAFTFSAASAQLPDGSLAPNFTGTDLNGNTHTLYEYLQQGYTVVVDISATWCGPCWNYHNTHALEDLWEQHGVDNGGTVVVLFIEGDPQTTNAQLNGIGAGTQGNWVEGTPYPIIDDAAIGDILATAYFPTIYTICPNGIITETGQLSAAQHWNFINQNSCQTVAETDMSVLNYNGDPVTCADADLSVEIANLGTNPITNATISVSGVTPPISFNWSGSLSQFESEVVDLGSATVTGQVDISIATAGDGVATNNTITNAIALAEESTTNIVVYVRFDNWAEELGWTIRNENGNVIASRAEGYYDGQAANAEVWENVFVPSSGCYSIEFTDAFGDGLFGSQYGGVNGRIEVYSIENGNNFGNIWLYNGDYNFEAEATAANVTTVVGVEENEANISLNVYPNPANNIANVNFSITESADVLIEVINLTGAKVASFNKGNLAAGNYNHQLEVNNFAAGVYMVNVVANGQVNTMRVTVEK